MLKMTVNKSASLQLETAAIYFDILPNRIASAQASAMESAKRKATSELTKFGKAAKYLSFSITRYGPVGVKMTVSPSKNRGRAGKYGKNVQIASAILLTGRKGGRIVKAKTAGGKMKVRPESVRQGYNAYYSAIELAPIQSKREQIKREMRKIVIQEISNKLKAIGIGARGGVTRTRDFGSVRGV